MRKIYKKTIIAFILSGIVLVILQIGLAFSSVFISLDGMITSTATSLLSSTNREIMENIDAHFERMIFVGNKICTDQDFKDYSRTDTSLAQADRVAKELSLGQKLSGYSALDNFSDCGIVFKDGTYLGQFDAKTFEAYPGEELYTTFSKSNEGNDEAFLTSLNTDYSRIYFSKNINASTLFVVSILREELNPVFYDAEENFDLTLRLTTPNHQVVYSGDNDEMLNGMLDSDLAQAVENSKHISIETHGNVIASDVCTNGWRVTSTIPQDLLSGENTSLRTIYLIISLVVIGLTIGTVILLCRLTKQRMEEFENIEENLEEFTDIENLNIDA